MSDDRVVGLNDAIMSRHDVLPAMKLKNIKGELELDCYGREYAV